MLTFSVYICLSFEFHLLLLWYLTLGCFFDKVYFCSIYNIFSHYYGFILVVYFCSDYTILCPLARMEDSVMALLDAHCSYWWLLLTFPPFEGSCAGAFYLILVHVFSCGIMWFYVVSCNMEFLSKFSTKCSTCPLGLRRKRCFLFAELTHWVHACHWGGGRCFYSFQRSLED